MNTKTIITALVISAAVAGLFVYLNSLGKFPGSQFKSYVINEAGALEKRTVAK